ncbi:MAG: hypothetical protein K6F09_01440 [Clostridiales bacterium]|nr:hypothetical protein [Clostridiales bacterium]
MKQALFNKGIVEPKCRHCEYGRLTPDGETVLCIKRGIMEADSSCRSFSYDPLKRIPRKAPKIPEYSADDFSI